MPLVSARLRPRLVALAAMLAATALAACGSVTGPSEPSAKAPRIAPKIGSLDGGTTDTAANRPTIPWY